MSFSRRVTKAPNDEPLNHHATEPRSHQATEPPSLKPPNKIAICRVICQIFCWFLVCWLVLLFVLLRSVAVFALQPPGGNQVDGLPPAPSWPKAQNGRGFNTSINLFISQEMSGNSCRAKTLTCFASKQYSWSSKCL